MKNREVPNYDVAAYHRPKGPLGGSAVLFTGLDDFGRWSFQRLCRGSRNLLGGCDILFFGYEREYERSQLGPDIRVGSNRPA
jgi:hypothetical protein